MKTKIPKHIKTVEEAKNFLSSLHKNGESFHPKDDANALCGDPFTKNQGNRLNKLMEDIYNLNGNKGNHQSPEFDPCAYLLQLDNNVTDTTFIKRIWTEDTGGGIKVDYAELSTGIIISITEDAVTAFSNYDEVESGEGYFAAMDLTDKLEETIKVHVRGGVAYCEDSRVEIIDHD